MTGLVRWSGRGACHWCAAVRVVVGALRLWRERTWTTGLPTPDARTATCWLTCWLLIKDTQVRSLFLCTAEPWSVRRQDGAVVTVIVVRGRLPTCAFSSGELAERAGWQRVNTAVEQVHGDV